MASQIDELIKELKEYRDGMVVRNLPFQWISDIITKWEMKNIKTVSEELQDELEPIKKDFYEEAEKEKKELDESYKESVRQANERKE